MPVFTVSISDITACYPKDSPSPFTIDCKKTSFGSMRFWIVAGIPRGFEIDLPDLRTCPCPTCPVKCLPSEMFTQGQFNRDEIFFALISSGLNLCCTYFIGAKPISLGRSLFNKGPCVSVCVCLPS